MMLHSKLRIPMHLPGRQGVLFIAFLIIGRSTSKYNFATSLSCLGASSLLFFNLVGHNDPFMPVVFILFGIVLDVLYNTFTKIKNNIWTVSLACSLSWMTITIFKLIFSLIFHIPETSLLSGLLYPLSTHLIFGFFGGMLGTSAIMILNKKK